MAWSEGERDHARPTVFELLRDRILRAEFVPGQRLVEADLAVRFGASRGSVRSALMDLTGAGLVERVPNRGARVREVSMAEAVEITECRMALEGLCAAKAASRVGTVETDELTGIIAAMRVAVSQGDLLGYSDLNHRLHLRIMEISQQRTAARAIERLRGQFVRHQFRLALRPGRARVSLTEHELVVAAIADRDPASAELAMREHLRSVIAALAEVAAEQVCPTDC